VSYAVCGPSRAGLITGRYQDKFGFSKNPLLAPNDPDMGLPINQQTLADLLKQANYTTGAIGKWHLGAHQTLRPNKRGFDEFYGFLSGGHRYFPADWTLKDLSEAKSENDGYKTKLLRNNQRVEEKEYITDAFSREAVDFVERNQKKPFFLYLAYNAPHAPLQATEKYLDRFKSIKDPKRRTYAAMVSAVDDGVGQLLDKIESLKLDDHTLLFFLSDNGGPIEDNGSNNAPLRGKKGDFFEGGIRVPFAVKWKGKIPAGIIYDQPIISLDIFATAAALVHIKPKNDLDGVNLMPYLLGQNKSNPHEELYYRNFERNRFAIVTPTFKSISDDNQSILFNLKDDQSEKIDISHQNKTVLDKLESQVKVWTNFLKPPVFDGLLDGEIYTKKNPDRWKITINK
jgi:arylsulfatase A-like enzyme